MSTLNSKFLIAAAFFHGQVEQPVRGLMSLVNHKDVEVLIAVNERGVFIIDPSECLTQFACEISVNNFTLAPCMQSMYSNEIQYEKVL
ncbi:hypothetical protein FF38_01276 [Lucilia cuprina]|uniref:Uncharacterized protein n=1 Tax=Lucilia cuprina TaxID=7375 RepID=A0A0L0BUQ9_LUCCU|nr:hypothetical protein FF38_01276 [Lucilia cuprina]